MSTAGEAWITGPSPVKGTRSCSAVAATIDFSQPDTGERRLAIADQLARVIPGERDADRVVCCPISLRRGA
jgi:hypothetical protein